MRVSRSAEGWRKVLELSWPAGRVVAGQVAIAILAGTLASWLQIPVGWLLGPMVVGILYAAVQGNPKPLPAAFMLVGKAIVGLATAVRFSPETLSLAQDYALPMLLGVLLTGGLSLFHGYLFSRWTGIDRTTGLLAFIPGAASSIVALGEELEADAIAIALFQYLRLLLVVLLVPSLAVVLLPAPLLAQPPVSLTAANLSHLPLLPNLGLLLACAALGIWAGKRLRLPASGFLGAFLVCLIAFWSLPALGPYQLGVPRWLFNSGLLLVGLAIGLKFDWQTARQLIQALLIEVGLVLSLILLCFGIGYEFHAATGIEVGTALLGFTPGGLEAMVATAMQLGSDTGLVMAMQMTRMLLILAIAPWLPTFLPNRAQSLKPQPLKPQNLHDPLSLDPDKTGIKIKDLGS